MAWSICDLVVPLLRAPASQLLGGPPDEPGSSVVAVITYDDEPLDPVVVENTVACVMFHSEYYDGSITMNYTAFTGAAPGAVPRIGVLASARFTYLVSGGGLMSAIVVATLTLVRSSHASVSYQVRSRSALGQADCV